jgi:hypothetical protein
MIVATDTLNRLAYERRIRHLWRLGPRPIGELLLELAEIAGRRTWLDRRLDDYAAIDGDTLDLLGARDWPPPILHLAGGGRT